MVISIAIPSAILNTSTVDGFNGTPTQPITPAVINSGITLGISEHNRMRKERKRYNMHNAINRNAQIILSFNPFMINELPSRKVTLEPVISTWYLFESKK